MTHGCVTLDEVFAAAGVRAASLVPETSGYLALAIGDATSRLPFAIEERSVMLTTEGNVGITRRGDMLPPKQAARGLREVLSRLLAASQGTAMPALAHASRNREESERGVDTVVEEIEAALIPVNRAAARRALARLARETIKAKEAGKVKPRPPKPATEARPADATPAEAKPAEAKPAEAKPAEAKPAEAKPAEAKPAEAKPAESVEAPRTVEATATLAQQLEVEATTPPPVEPRPHTPAPTSARPRTPTLAPTSARPRTPTPAPVVAAPRTPTPAPAIAARPRLELPPPPEADPTPTVLGMSAVEIDGPAPQPEGPPEAEPEVDVIAAAPPREEAVEAAPVEVVPVEAAPAEEETAIRAAAPVDAEIPEDEAVTVAASAVRVTPEDELPTDLGEPAVLLAPSEEPEDAFELGRRPRPIAEPITPPFALDAEPAPRELPVARVAREPAPRVTQPSWHNERSNVHTRADDLLARFGASCADDAGMREAAACLRRIAGIEPTPPPARVELRIASLPEPRPYEALARIPQDAETPVTPRVRPRRAWSLPSVGVTLLVLVAGLAGGGALVRLRPDLFGAVTRPADPAGPAPAAARKDPASDAPAATAEPTGALAPSFADRLGGARAERGTTERAR
jgi:hypothetical protein